MTDAVGSYADLPFGLSSPCARYENLVEKISKMDASHSMGATQRARLRTLRRNDPEVLLQARQRRECTALFFSAAPHVLSLVAGAVPKLIRYLLN